MDQERGFVAAWREGEGRSGSDAQASVAVAVVVSDEHQGIDSQCAHGLHGGLPLWLQHGVSEVN